jgi:hypothetical protein
MLDVQASRKFNTIICKSRLFFWTVEDETKALHVLYHHM